MTGFIIPLVISFILCYGLYKKVNVFDEFIAGAKEGLSTSFDILPSLIALMTCVGMFKASGGLNLLATLAEPIAEFFNMPKEVVPLALIRPLSGSGALSVYQNILASYGADSRIGRTASILMGSTETTFYTIAIYYGAMKITKSRHTLPCALMGDMLGFIFSGIVFYLFFG